MAEALEAVTGSSGRPPGNAADDEVVGMMSCWQAVEAHAHARMLAAARELIRRRVPAGDGPDVGGWDLAPDATRPGPRGGFGAGVVTR